MSTGMETTAYAGKPPKVSHVKEGLPAEAKAELVADLTNPEPEVPEGEVITGFDYDSILDPDLRQMAQNAAQRIAENNHTIESKVLDTGRTLIAFKEAIKSQGKLFGEWIEAACPFSYKTGLNYMAVAREFGEDYLLLTYIPSQTLYPLASGKDMSEVRSKVVEAAKGGSPMPLTDVMKLISQANSTDSHDNADEIGEARKSAAKNAITWLREKHGFEDFLKLVREAGREFTIVLNMAAKEARDA